MGMAQPPKSPPMLSHQGVAPLERIIRLGDMALLEEECHWGWACFDFDFFFPRINFVLCQCWVSLDMMWSSFKGSCIERLALSYGLILEDSRKFRRWNLLGESRSLGRDLWEHIILGSFPVMPSASCSPIGEKQFLGSHFSCCMIHSSMQEPRHH